MAKIKTPEEIVILREGGKILARILHAAGELAVPGALVADIDAFVEREMHKAGGAPAFLGYASYGAMRPFPASVCISINDEAVHGVPTEGGRVIQDGDIVSLDAGLTYKGMITDMCITVPAGSVDQAGLLLIEAARKARDAGVAASRGGARLGDIGAAIEKSLEGTVFSVIPDLGGHGVGHKVHEPPHIFHTGDAGTGPELVPGMVITIEPTISEGGTDIVLGPDDWTYSTTDGSRTAQFEHTIVITEGDPEIITLP